MFTLINLELETEINSLISRIPASDPSEIAAGFQTILENIHSRVPAKKRISYGRYSIAKELGLYLHPLLVQAGIDVPEFSRQLFGDPDNEQFVRSLAVQLNTIHADRIGNPSLVFPMLEKAAADDNWIVRECSAGFVRKLIKPYRDQMNKWYLKMVRSEDPLKRRFACESLRPVADNGWFKNSPEFAFGIIENLYHEGEAYPRTSIGNSLSDWMRIDRDRALAIVRRLADNGDKNSYWIAYRACRNLVKKEPLLVMDILKTDEYKYKDRRFFRSDYNGEKP